ncbi:uncharacterized protein LY79DRAFT_251326 [Colletotrichum navitas]|uniref:Uncharacterized protein n=1 Tax=Colletotrichum navitas TaxID=681940 RepID=A0AAD8QAL2_9PEZI|nr:uncharacterized protein LY79DRAFT_251326 [Colletotrichum navitas]KAK1598659.1 hypothetical protein LY79DRAFT_251326 [Colletotrichum navitas]
MVSLLSSMFFYYVVPWMDLLMGLCFSSRSAVLNCLKWLKWLRICSKVAGGMFRCRHLASITSCPTSEMIARGNDDDDGVDKRWGPMARQS